MLPFIPRLLLFLLLAGPALLTPSTSTELQLGGQRTPRDTKQDSFKVVISEGCATQDDASDGSKGGKEIDLVPGSPLVLTHKIKLVPSDSASGSASCGCDADFAPLRERLERLEREVSALRETCGGAEGNCCSSNESKGAACSIKPETKECPNECSDQGRCEDGKCACFPGFTGPDCNQSNCPGDCSNNGKCVNGQCVCDPGFTGPDCSLKACPDNCNNHGRCVNGKCVCNSGFTGPSCSDKSCPGNCKKRGLCVNGQCVCNPGFTGHDCSLRSCPDNCNNQGRCVNGKCVCNSGFTGPSCLNKSCPSNCNRRGRCNNGQCVCNPGFAGPDCLKRTCPDNCNDHGRCVNGKCVCNSGFTGADCSEAVCPENCNNRGRCVNGQCVCDDGFTGADCSAKGCPNNCDNRGRCVDGQCVCDDRFTGEDCSERTCPNDCNDRGRCVNGKCICDSGFTGDDCSENTCPNNCNNRGRCVNGQCVCEDGFTGPDCSEKTCLNSCNNRGRCVDGQCVCDDRFTGEDCSERTCPNDCNDRGRCVNGKCICDSGFTGDDCSENTCPNNCNNRGRCVNGQCVCEDGFTGADCSAKGCPNSCNNRGRCFRGNCVCRRGFTGPDCSQCQEGMTGPNCDVVMSGVSRLSTQDITDTSVALVWTPPPVQYETYYITFTSQKESDQQITAQVEGSLTTYTQTGLAAGQDFRVSIVGEIDGRRGGESTAEFMTLISGPTDLKVVKMSSSSAVVQWEPTVGEIDRYRLTITPNDGAGRRQEMTIPADQNSAQIQQLEAGRLYDILLVAEKGASRSAPETTQVAPGRILPRFPTPASPPYISKESTLTIQASLAPTQDVSSIHQDLNPSAQGQIFDQREKTEDVSKANSDVQDKDSSAPIIIARTKPVVNKMFSINGTSSKPIGKSILPRKQLHFNATRVVPRRRPFKKVMEKKNLKPGVPIIRQSVSDPSIEASSSDRVDKNKAMLPGTHSETKIQSSSKESTAAVDLKGPPHVGIAVHGSDTGTVQSQEKKCINKIKVTHLRLPLKDRGNGCRGAEAGMVEKTLSPDLGSPLSAKPDLDYKPDPLHKLLKDTFESMNISTFSVHLSKPSNLSVNADIIGKQILRGLKPLPSLSSSPTSSESQSSSHSSASKTSHSPAASPSPLPLSSPSPPSPGLDASTAGSSSSQMYLIISSPSSLPSPPPSTSLSLPTTSSSPSRADKFDSHSTNELSESSRSISEPAPPTDRKPPPFREGGVPRINTPKYGIRRRPYTKFGPFQNKTHINSRFRLPSHRINLSPEMTAENKHRPTSELLSLPSISTSEESSSVKASVPVKDTSGLKNGTATPDLSEIEQNQKNVQIERQRIANRCPPFKKCRFLKGGPFQNQTRRIGPLNRETEPRKEQVVSNDLTATSAPLLPKGPVRDADDGGIGTRISSTSSATEFNRTLRGRGMPTSHRPNTKLGYIPRQVYHRRLKNGTQRLPQRPYNYPPRKYFPNKEVNAGSTGNQTGQLRSILTRQNVQHPTHQIPIREGDQDTAADQIDGQTNVRSQTENLGTGDRAVAREEDISGTDSQLQEINERGNPGKSNETRIQDRPTKQLFPNSRPSSSVTFPTRQPAAKTIPAQHHTHIRHYTGGSQKSENPKTFESKTKQTNPTSDLSSSGVLREPLDFVGVTNQTTDGFTLIWDSPEGKYKNFVVTRKEARKEEDMEPKEKVHDYQDSGKEGGREEEKENRTPNRDTISKNVGTEDENRVPESLVTHAPRIQSKTIIKPTENEKAFKKVLPGSARSFRFEDLPPQTEYTLTLLGKGPGVLSRLHKLVISTGPEPPSNIVFSKVTENSVTVSWTKPKSNVSGFKVTYTHAEDGEPVSVSLDSKDSTVGLSKLSPGSSYEVTVISTLGLDESDPVKDFVMALPDPPTHLRAVNVTDSTALLLWRPALAAVDKYSIVYGAGTGSEVKVTVSGNAAEQQLSGLEGSTTYTVTVTSQLGSQESSPATTSFTTTGGSGKVGEGPQDLQASNVTPRTATLSWKPPSKPVGNYRLSYRAKDKEMKEVIVDGSLTQYNLTRLHPGSTYTLQLQAEEGGQYTSAISTEFTTGTLRYPFPTDCSQELLNGIMTSGEAEIFPQGRHGTPVTVSCDMETDGGGWTVFQRRKDGSENFFRRWNEYIEGFGDVNGEFWLGLASIHNLTAMSRMSLRVDLRDGDESVFAQYSTFEVAKRNYKLTVGGYSGTAGDSLSYHNNRIFSTKDRDLAPFITRCAMSYRGGWWYKNCHEANLNGLYGVNTKHQGVIWTTWKGKDFSVPFTEMKMRPAAFRPPSRG
ncbi:tenascin isoform X2 [Oreochromis niloticus]|uniref:tenascin isoform X2 n=1 Tax=Oreochromis niloticus TaxID=8128 RepID=UPI000DF16290|nr:tenascin isoform X2 [Oreochromis niloticus]